MEIELYTNEKTKEYVMVFFEAGKFATPNLLLDQGDIYKLIGKLNELEKEIERKDIENEKRKRQSVIS